MKAKLRKSEAELEQIQSENQGFREERDRLRRRVGGANVVLTLRRGTETICLPLPHFVRPPVFVHYTTVIEVSSIRCKSPISFLAEQKVCESSSLIGNAFETGRLPEVNISHARTVVSFRFLNKSSLMYKRYLAI